MSTYDPPVYKPGFQTLARAFMHTAFNFQIRGQANLIDPPFLLISNHLHHADTPAFATAIPNKMYGIGAKKIEHTLLGRLFGLGAVIWIEQDSADTQALKEAMKVVRGGYALALYPEGHRSKQPGMSKGKEGAAFIANRSKVPIIPASITGTHQFLKEPRPTVVLTIGEPFTLPAHRAKADELRFYTDYLMCVIGSLLPETYHGVYANHPLMEQIRQSGTQVIDELLANDFHLLSNGK